MLIDVYQNHMSLKIVIHYNENLKENALLITIHFLKNILYFICLKIEKYLITHEIRVKVLRFQF